MRSSPTLDELGLRLRNPVDQFRLRHRPIPPLSSVRCGAAPLPNPYTGLHHLTIEPIVRPARRIGADRPESREYQHKPKRAYMDILNATRTILRCCFPL